MFTPGKGEKFIWLTMNTNPFVLTSVIIGISNVNVEYILGSFSRNKCDIYSTSILLIIRLNTLLGLSSVSLTCKDVQDHFSLPLCVCPNFLIEVYLEYGNDFTFNQNKAVNIWN